MIYSPQTVVFNHYRIDAFLAKGAFGEVYRVYDENFFNTPRALKIIHRNETGLGVPEINKYIERFSLEAQLGDSINHPHVVRVYGFEKDSKKMGLVMEYVAGVSLAAKLYQLREDSKLMPIAEALRLAREIAEGLGALHDKDVIHRDLKPDNILISERGGAKIADLGLAQDKTSRRSLEGSLASKHPGTPGYMSPEQENSTAPLRPTSDIYALGAVLFEMLVGRRYSQFNPGTKVKTLRRDIPGWLDKMLLEQMLAYDCGNRFSNGNEAANQLAYAEKKYHSRPFTTGQYRSYPNYFPVYPPLSNAQLSTKNKSEVPKDSRKLWAIMGITSIGMLGLCCSGMLWAIINLFKFSPAPTSVIPPPVFAEPSLPTTNTPTFIPSPSYWAVISVSSANVRTGPGTVYPILDSYPQKTQFEAIGRNTQNSWLLVVLPDNRQGWISTSVVEINFRMEQLLQIKIIPTPPIATSSATSTPKPTRLSEDTSSDEQKNQDPSQITPTVQTEPTATEYSYPYP